MKWATTWAWNMTSIKMKRVTTSDERTRREGLVLRLVESWITRNHSTSGQLAALKTSISTSTVFALGVWRLMLEKYLQLLPLNVSMVCVINRLKKNTLTWELLNKYYWLCHHFVNGRRNIWSETDYIKRIPLYEKCWWNDKIYLKYNKKNFVLIKKYCI